MFSTIVSVVPFLIEERKPLIPAHYVIPPCKNFKIPKFLHVDDAFHYIYIDENRPPLRQITPSLEVARSVVQDYVSSQLGIDDDAAPGIFYVPGQLGASAIIEKYKPELEDAVERQKRWFISICKLADDEWQRYKRHGVVSTFQREAAEIIGWRAIEHPWMSPLTTQQSTPCPACGLTTVKGTVVCANCKCILDQVAFKQLQFA